MSPRTPRPTAAGPTAGPTAGPRPARAPNPSHVRLGGHHPHASQDAYRGAARGSHTDRARDPGPSALDILVAGLRGADEPGEAPPPHDLGALLDRLSPRDADLLELYLTPRTNPRSQYELAQIFGVTQSAVSHGLQRAIRRLRWLVRWQHLDADRMRTRLTASGLDEDRVNILTYYWTTGSQLETARLLRLGESTARTRLLTGLHRLVRSPGYEDVHRAFVELLNHGPLLCGARFKNKPGPRPNGVRQPRRVEQYLQLLTARGRTQTISQWSIESGVPAATIYRRTYQGWPPEHAIGEPLRGRR